METKHRNLSKNSAFSLIELLVVVATLAVIGAVAVIAISGSKSAIESTKLEQDVAQLNTAIDVFLSNGGSLDNITTAQDVLTELKREAANQKSVVGLRGSAVDLRLQAIEDTDGELRQRANWNAGLGKFVLEETKTGVREFAFNEALADVDYEAIDRNTRLVYNPAAGWVWESIDYAYSTVSGPSNLATLNAPTLGAIGGGGGSATARLGTPTISPDGGTLPLAAYPLRVSIAKHPGDPQSAKIFFSTVSGTWVEYSGSFVVDPGTIVSAYTSHDDPVWSDSELATSTFTNDPARLEIALNVPKNLITYAEAGGPLEGGNYTAEPSLAPITVSLTSSDAIPAEYENNNYFNVHWTYDGSDPRNSSDRHSSGHFNGAYNGGSIEYTLPRWDGASLLPIQIVAQSNNPAFVEDSAVLSANISIRQTKLPEPVIRYNATDTSRGDTVEIDKVVDGGDMPVGARIYYTTDGTDPGDDGNGNPVSGTLYTGPFDPLVDNDFETEAVIVARVYAPVAAASWFKVSNSANSDYEVPAFEISGVASGWFSNAIGVGKGNNGHGNNLDDYDVSNNGNPNGGPTGGFDASEGFDDEQGNNGKGNGGGSKGHESFLIADNFFQWGDAGNWGTGANWLHFAGNSFEDVSANDRFKIGNLSYYNGTISMDSVATSVDFAVELAFGGAAAQFDYTFDLLTTANTGNAWQNADYVWFNDTESSQYVSLYGVDYSLNLDFGQTSHFGFSSVDQFHVQESQSATADIFARLVEVEAWW